MTESLNISFVILDALKKVVLIVIYIRVSYIKYYYIFFVVFSMQTSVLTGQSKTVWGLKLAKNKIDTCIWHYDAYANLNLIIRVLEYDVTKIDRYLLLISY